MESSNSANKEVIREFNKNYRAFLETSYIFNLLNDILLNSQQVNYENPSLEDKLSENFLKSIHLTSNNNEIKNTELSLLLKPDKLNNESKKFLISKIEAKLEKNLKDINETLDFDKDLASNFNSNQHDIIPVKVSSLIDLVNKLEFELDKSSQEYNVKLEYCFNISIEIINMLKTMLDDFKLTFYANKNALECEKEVLNCDLLFIKMKQVESELVNDLYSFEKTKALGVIRNQIDMDTRQTKARVDQAELSLNLFKSLGKDFDKILNEYTTLKTSLENKKIHLKQLKEDLEY